MRLLSYAVASCLLAACAAPEDDAGLAGEELGPNPFLEDQANPGKEDTAYLNPDGVEVEVDLEGDVEAPGWRRKDAPAEVGQFALTYLRKRGKFYLESLAEDASSGERVEWKVGEEWLTAADAAAAGAEDLRRFRIRGINAVLLHGAAEGVDVGSEFEAVVPVNPYGLMGQAGDKCADPDGHMSLADSVYWYLWNPDRAGCEMATQKLRLTVSRMFPRSHTPYPEYDRLVEDGKVTAVVLFGQIGDDPLSEWDAGLRGYNSMASWLDNAGYDEVTPAPVGRRFVKHVGDVDFELDLYSPRDFKGLSDMAHFANFERALKEHEIVTYDGHSMLGASDFWSRPGYLDGYQIFLYGGCLGYEYYVRPILEKKGGWADLDLMSSVIEVSAGAMDFAGPLLAKVEWALGNGYAANWADLLRVVRMRVGDSTFGASGVRDNCFTPTGSRCGATPDPAAEARFEGSGPVAIPDDDPAGATSAVEVEESFPVAQVTVELDVTHSYVGDLYVALKHGDQETPLWVNEGGSGRDLVERFVVSGFQGADSKGAWTLSLVDSASRDEGKLNGWTLVLGRQEP